MFEEGSFRRRPRGFRWVKIEIFIDSPKNDKILSFGLPFDGTNDIIFLINY